MDQTIPESSSELRRQLDALRKREQQLTDLVENASVGMSYVDDDGIVLWANQSELDMLGLRKEEYVGKPIAAFHSEAATVGEMLARWRAREPLMNYESRLRCKDGSTRSVLINSNILWDGSRFLYTRCFTRDITDWKLIQEHSRQTQEMLAALVHSSPLPIIALTTDGNITVWNEASERLFGWRAEEVLGGPIPFIPADKLQEHRAMRARDLQGKGFSEQELRRSCKDGSTIDIRVSTAALRGSDGSINGIMSVYVDLTERKRYEKRLLAQYELASILAEAFSIQDAAPRLLKTLCDNLGSQAGLFWTIEAGGEAKCEFSIGEFSDISRGSSLPPGVGLPGQICATRNSTWINHLSQHDEEPDLRAGAKAGFKAAFGFPVFVKGSVAAVFEFLNFEPQISDLAFQDMTTAVAVQIGEFLERMLSEKRVRDREARYQALTETAADGIVTIDAGSTILLANASAGRIFGYEASDLVGSDLTNLMPDYLKQVHKTAFAKYQETGERHISWHAVQVPGKHQKGHEIPLEISFAEYEQDGKPVFIGIIRDVTERKRFDEKLQQTAKLESLGLLAGGIAHDFNNLLTGILGNASLAIETLPAPHAAVELLQNAIQAGEQAANLTKQLLAYAGKGRFVIQLIDLSAAAREIGTLVKGSIPKSVHLRFEFADHLPYIEADSTQIQQIIMNLVINGAEAIPPGEDGTVLITTGVQEIDDTYIAQTLGNAEIASGKYVSLEVHDTGCGMDEATINKIFDPFFTTKFTGRGLGLAAVLGIVRGHKGTLKVYSSPGKGTTFKVLFPASEERTPKSGLEASPPSFKGKGLILVVDDEPIIRRVLTSILKRFGFDVLEAQNGRDAVEMFEQMMDQIALIILDLTMPVMNGEAALGKIKLLNPRVPILLSSGFNEMEAIQRFAGKGLAGFVQKPYTSAQLAERLKQVFEL